jgi:hypothetical protein
MCWESQNPLSVGRAMGWVGENTSAIAFLFFFKIVTLLINFGILKENCKVARIISNWYK